MKNLKDKAIQIKGKEYVQVKDRVLFLSDQYVDKYSIETDYEYFPERRMWVVKAKLTINNQVYTGLAQEIESDNYKEVNYSSALENAETSAVGRACAFAGIGILDSIASVDEVNKAVNRGSQFNNYATPKPKDSPATTLQINFAKTIQTRKPTETAKWMELHGKKSFEELTSTEISGFITQLK